MELQWRKDFVISSPLALYKDIHELMIRDVGLSLSQDKPPSLESTGIVDVATFRAQMSAQRIVRTLNWINIIIGALLLVIAIVVLALILTSANRINSSTLLLIGIVLGAVLITAGLYLLNKSSGQAMAGLTVTMDGETYRCERKLDETGASYSRYDLVSQGRIWIYEDTTPGIEVPADVRKLLELEFPRITQEMDQLLTKRAADPHYLPQLLPKK